MSFSAGILAMGAANLALSPGVPAAAPEFIVDEAPVSASVKDEPAPMEEAYPEEVRLPTAFPRLRKRLEKAAPFWRDTQLRKYRKKYNPHFH